MEVYCWKKRGEALECGTWRVCKARSLEGLGIGNAQRLGKG